MARSPYTQQTYTQQPAYEQTTPNVSSFDPTTDPLGIAVQGRARQARFQQAVHGVAPQGPLPDPRWDGYFQAAGEAGGGRNVSFDPSGSGLANDVRPDHGMVSGPLGYFGAGTGGQQPTGGDERLQHALAGLKTKGLHA